MEAVWRERPGSLPRVQVRTGCRGRADLERRRGRVELGVRRDRRDPLTPGRRPAAVVLVVSVLLIAAFVVRVVYVESTHYKALNDAGTYNRMASMISQFGDYHTGSGP